MFKTLICSRGYFSALEEQSAYELADAENLEIRTVSALTKTN